MSRGLKIVLFVLAAVAGLFLLVTPFVETKRTVVRSVVIKVSAEEVFEQINKPRNWENWVPGNDRCPDTKYYYSGNVEGPRAKQIAESETCGNIEIEISGSTPNEIVSFDIFMEKAGLLGKGSITIDPTKDGVKVDFIHIWDLGELPFHKRLLAVMMFDSMIGGSLEQSAEGLRDWCEAN